MLLAICTLKRTEAQSFPSVEVLVLKLRQVGLWQPAVCAAVPLLALAEALVQRLARVPRWRLVEGRVRGSAIAGERPEAAEADQCVHRPQQRHLRSA